MKALAILAFALIPATSFAVITPSVYVSVHSKKGIDADPVDSAAVRAKIADYLANFEINDLKLLSRGVNNSFSLCFATTGTEAERDQLVQELRALPVSADTSLSVAPAASCKREE
jgi:hypothetical protein